MRRYGAAVVVIAFDASGTGRYPRTENEICPWAYKILTEEVGFRQDVICTNLKGTFFWQL
ncbi:hypothetical protein ACLB1N_22580 [Escherichia coli]